MHCLVAEVERLDAELASLARVESALRLRLGQVMEVLSRGGHFDLGFSSMRAYALERCDRSPRWAEAARCLARRVEPLPQLRHALAFGEVSWSMGELLARVAQREDEALWLEAAKGRTVRQMRVLITQASSDAREAARTHLITSAAESPCNGA
jgi:HAMP domain-containing protein